MTIWELLLVLPFCVWLGWLPAARREELPDQLQGAWLKWSARLIVLAIAGRAVWELATNGRLVLTLWR